MCRSGLGGGGWRARECADLDLGGGGFGGLGNVQV